MNSFEKKLQKSEKKALHKLFHSVLLKSCDLGVYYLCAENESHRAMKREVAVIKRGISAEYVTITEWGVERINGIFPEKGLMEHPVQCAICHPPV